MSGLRRATARRRRVTSTTCPRSTRCITCFKFCCSSRMETVEILAMYDILYDISPPVKCQAAGGHPPRHHRQPAHYAWSLRGDPRTRRPHEHRSGSGCAIIRALNKMEAVVDSQLAVDPCERARSRLLNTSNAEKVAR